MATQHNQPADGRTVAARLDTIEARLDGLLLEMRPVDSPDAAAERIANLIERLVWAVKDAGPETLARLSRLLDDRWQGAVDSRDPDAAEAATIANRIAESWERPGTPETAKPVRRPRRTVAERVRAALGYRWQAAPAETETATDDSESPR